MSSIKLKRAALGLMSGSALLVAPTANAQWWEETLSGYFGTAKMNEDVGSRHFRIGGVASMNVQAKFSMNGSFGISGNNPGPAGVRGVDHVYDDGYVLVDVTGNDGNATHNFGFRSTTQYTNSTQRLYFKATDSFAVTSGGANETGEAQLGLEAVYGGHLLRWGDALIGLELGFTYLPIEIKDNQSLAALANRTVHSYDVSNVQIPGLQGPAGTGAWVYEGTFNGPGVYIDDLAQAEPGESIPGTLTGERTLDVTVYNFRLGPTVQWQVHPRAAVALSVGGSVGFISGDLNYNEVLVLNDGSRVTNRGGSGGTEMIYGGYVSGLLKYRVEKNGDIYLGAQWTPMTDATFNSGGRAAELNLSGALHVTFGFNWSF